MLFFILVLIFLHGLIHTSMCDLGKEREAELLSSMWDYTPELPRSLLSAAVGMQGDRTRLERVMGSIMRGEMYSVPAWSVCRSD